MLKYAKIKALAVREDARGRGTGAALLKRCVQVYWQLDCMLLFGKFETTRDLGPYYTRQGFTVPEPKLTIDAAPCSPAFPSTSAQDQVRRPSTGGAATSAEPVQPAPYDTGAGCVDGPRVNPGHRIRVRLVVGASRVRDYRENVAPSTRTQQTELGRNAGNRLFLAAR